MPPAPKPGILERLAPHISIANAHVDLAETNALLREITDAMNRQAHAMELILLHAFNVNMNGGEDSVEDLPITSPEFREFDPMTDPERLAMVEWLEQEGYEVPLDVYRQLGIDPPPRPDKGEPDAPDAEQAAPPDPPTARKDLS